VLWCLNAMQGEKKGRGGSRYAYPWDASITYDRYAQVRVGTWTGCVRIGGEGKSRLCNRAILNSFAVSLCTDDFKAGLPPYDGEWQPKHLVEGEWYNILPESVKREDEQLRYRLWMSITI